MIEMVKNIEMKRANWGSGTRMNFLQQQAQVDVTAQIMAITSVTKAIQIIITTAFSHPGRF